MPSHHRVGRSFAEGRFRRIAVEKVDSALEPFLRDAGFVATPKGLVLYA